jgi:uncharacterized damage-inducible protein DinB
MLHSRVIHFTEVRVTYYGAKHLADSFRTVRKNTLTIAEEIPEDKYGFRATPDVMSIGEMLAHLAVSPMWQIEVHGGKVERVDFAFFAARQQQSQAEQQALRSKAEIIRALQENGEKFAAFVEGLDEATLASMVAFPPPVQPATKSRFEMLMGPKEHEMHHRGQLMLLQRIIGQVPHLTRARQQMQAQAPAARTH